MTYALSAAQIETLQRACKTDGWAKTYRGARISDTTLRLALTGANLSQHTYECLRDYAARWSMDHPDSVFADATDLEKQTAWRFGVGVHVCPVCGVSDEAKEIIERMKTVRPKCEHCERAGYQPMAGAYIHALGRNWNELLRTEDVEAWALTQGFEKAVDHYGFLRRCATCASTLAFQWADQLDPERVAQMMESDPRCRHVFELELLKETLTAEPIKNEREWF